MLLHILYHRKVHRLHHVRSRSTPAGKPANNLKGMSGFALWLGIETGKTGIWRAIAADIDLDINSVLYVSGVALACFSFFMAIVAVCIPRMKTPLCYMPFGFVTFMMSVTSITTGLIALRVANDAETFIDAYCN